MRDARGEEPSARAQDAGGLAERAKTIGPLVQMVERSQEEYGRGRGRGEGQRPRVAPANAGERMLCLLARVLGLAYVLRREIQEVHVVALRGQPIGVSPASTPHVADHSRRGGKMAENQLFRARPLEGEVQSVETSGLVVGVVEGDDVAKGDFLVAHGRGHDTGAGLHLGP